MFAPETKDMLPRSAPRPSAAVPMGHSDGIIRPAVPEVSILFGQPPQDQQNLAQQPTNEPAPRPPTFASWKKQMLPRVNFSPVLTTELGPRPTPSTAHSNLVTSSKEYVIVPRDRGYGNDAPSSPNPLPINTGPVYAEAKKQFQPRRMSSGSTSDVLTICAGTQTDNRSPPRTSLPSVVYSDIDISNLADKSDLKSIVSMLESMRQEQQQLRRICEKMLEEQQRTKVESISNPTRTTATQCNILTANSEKRSSPIIQEYIVLDEGEEPLPQPVRQAARVIPHFQSPRATPPIAQSTGYRANTPQAKRIPQLAKPNTEKSMVMNELALKYLRQPVDELMKEMRLGSSPKTPNPEPLRPIDNFTHSQSPNDMSNASYKYLKKYRLLPEEQLDYGARDHTGSQSPATASSSPQMQLDLENIRNQPKLL
ncbi:hypothetical protein KR026_007829 [Drosophila bipectinata]|nr:hypothetical protein KR026_007829 [Drosophila bipectinata]